MNWKNINPWFSELFFCRFVSPPSSLAVYSFSMQIPKKIKSSVTSEEYFLTYFSFCVAFFDQRFNKFFFQLSTSHLLKILRVCLLKVYLIYVRRIVGFHYVMVGAVVRGRKFWENFRLNFWNWRFLSFNFLQILMNLLTIFFQGMTAFLARFFSRISHT